MVIPRELWSPPLQEETSEERFPERAETVNQAQCQSPIFAVEFVKLPGASEVADHRAGLRTPSVHAHFPKHRFHDPTFLNERQVIPLYLGLLLVLEKSQLRARA